MNRFICLGILLIGIRAWFHGVLRFVKLFSWLESNRFDFVGSLEVRYCNLEFCAIELDLFTFVLLGMMATMRTVVLIFANVSIRLLALFVFTHGV